MHANLTEILRLCFPVGTMKSQVWCSAYSFWRLCKAYLGISWGFYIISHTALVFMLFWSQIFSLRSLITTAEPSWCCAHLSFSHLSFMHAFPHLTRSPKTLQKWDKASRWGCGHSASWLCPCIPWLRDWPVGDDKALGEEPVCAASLTASLGHSQAFHLMLNETVWADSPAKMHGCTFPSAAPSTHLLVIQGYPLEANLEYSLGALPELPSLSRHISYN